MKYLYIIAFLLTSFGGVYQIGHHQGYEASEAVVQAKIAEANQIARNTEQSLNVKINDLTSQLQKVQDDAKKQIAKRDADIAAGKLQLFVKTKSTVCPTKDAPSTGGSDTATAQLDPAFAQSIVAVTDDGDLAIRKLNACIATYNQVKDMINGSTTTR